MSSAPASPKIYHITHVDNLRSILEAGCISSDARRLEQGLANTNIGMTEIKTRRLHLEADLGTVVSWAKAGGRRWAFSKSNAGAYYTRFFKDLDQLTEIDWDAVIAQDFRDAAIKEGKQAEFLLFGEFPLHLVARLGVIDKATARRVEAILGKAGNRFTVSVQRRWYY